MMRPPRPVHVPDLLENLERLLDVEPEPHRIEAGQYLVDGEALYALAQALRDSEGNYALQDAAQAVLDSANVFDD